MSNNNEHWCSDFGFAGSHTTFYHQCFQTVDLTIMNCKRTMNGLNQRALPHASEIINNALRSGAKEERKVQVEEWTVPKDYARSDNDTNPHDENVERKNTNRHDESHVDSDDEEEEEA